MLYPITLIILILRMLQYAQIWIKWTFADYVCLRFGVYPSPPFFCWTKKTCDKWYLFSSTTVYEFNVVFSTTKENPLKPLKKKNNQHKTHAGLLLAYTITKRCEDDKSLRLSLIAQWKNISNRSDKSSVKSFLQCDGGNAVICKY